MMFDYLRIGWFVSTVTAAIIMYINLCLSGYFGWYKQKKYEVICEKCGLHYTEINKTDMFVWPVIYIACIFLWPILVGVNLIYLFIYINY